MTYFKNDPIILYNCTTSAYDKMEKFLLKYKQGQSERKSPKQQKLRATTNVRHV